MKLSMKIILPVAAVTIIGMGVLLGRSYQMSAETMHDMTDKMQQMAVENIAYEVQKTHEYDESAALALATFSTVENFLLEGSLNYEKNRSDLTTLLRSFAKSFGFAHAGIIGLDGSVIADSDSSAIGRNVAGEAFFKRNLTGFHAVSTPYLYNGKTVVNLGNPIFKPGTTEVIGVAYIAIYQVIDVASIAETLGSYGRVVITNRDGIAFIHTNKSQEFKLNFNNISWGAEILKKKNGQVYFTEDGREKVAVFKEYPHLGWIVTTIADTAEVSAVSLENGKRSLLNGVGILLAIILILVFFVTRVTRALLKGVIYAQEIASGNLSTKLDVHSKDETGELADALRSIPEVLNNIITDYGVLENEIRNGSLLARVDTNKFRGDFIHLVGGTNNILSSFAAVLDNIPTPVVVLNSKLEAQYLNKLAVSISTQDYRGKKCFDLFKREDDSTEHDGLQNALRTKVPCSGETVAHPLAAGRLDVLYNAIPLLNDKGEVTSILQLITDVTNFKATQNTIMRVAETATTISTQVATAAEELSAQLQTAEESASIQAQRVSGAANTMASMNATVIEMAVNAKEASDVSSVAKVEAENGAQVVQKAVTSIQTVQDQSHELKNGMEQLNYSANAINEVITTISDIADQTNLLALNAAIEAARAGESGRGFAVVADEVRKLAEKTMTSTTEVRNAINSIQGSVNDSVKLVDDSVKAIELTSKLVTESGDVFLSIVNMVEQTATKSQVIANASDEQASNSEMVNGALGEVNLLATETANGMKEASVAVTDLSDQSQNLLELIAEMKKV